MLYLGNQDVKNWLILRVVCNNMSINYFGTQIIRILVFSYKDVNHILN